MATILLVDDEKVARTCTATTWPRAGHTVTCVGVGGRGASAALALHAFDVVVTDLILPDGRRDGGAPAHPERYPGVEVVVITALDKVDPAVRAIKNGAAEYLVKPVKPEALNHAVNRALTTRAAARGERRAQAPRLAGRGGPAARSPCWTARGSAPGGELGLPPARAGRRACMLWATSGDTVRLEASEGIAAEALPSLSPCATTPSSRTCRRAPFDAAWPEGPGRVLGFPVGEAARHHGWALLLDRAAGHRDPCARPPSTWPATWRWPGTTWSRFAAVEDLAYLDDLTRLYNARYLDVALERELHGKGPVQPALPRPGPLQERQRHPRAPGGQQAPGGGGAGREVLHPRPGRGRPLGRRRVRGAPARDGQRRRAQGGRAHPPHGGGAPLPRPRGLRAGRDGRASEWRAIPEHAVDRRTLLDLADRAMYRGKRTLAERGLRRRPRPARRSWASAAARPERRPDVRAPTPRMWPARQSPRASLLWRPARHSKPALRA